MSIVTLATDARPAFVQRFDAIRLRIRLVRLAACAAAAAVLFLAGLLGLAAFDYVFELPRIVRAVGVGLLVAATTVLFAVWTYRAWRQTELTRSAAKVEQRFPQLGQSVRTLVQYGDVSRADQLGATPSLAEALADDTSRRSRDLPLESIVPVRSFVAAGCAIGVLAAVLLGLGLMNWEWRTALQRALLDERPWTTLEVVPGATIVEEGKDLQLGALLQGRTERELTLFWRTAGETDWSEQRLTKADVSDEGPRFVRYEAFLPGIADPLEYRIAADDYAAGPFAVGVRRPLTIKSVAVELLPPEYTGLPMRTEATGDVTAIEGSRGRFRIELDRRPATAEMLVAPLRRSGATDGGPHAIPFSIEENVLIAELDLTEAFDWSVKAESDDGMHVRDNGWRVRIRQDGAPQLWFESPDEFLEVHTLAEILMAIRARDDFGLAQAGIVFQVNNEQEHTLLLEEFAAEPADDGRLVPRTRGFLERKLPLEFFELTEKDSVTYYAFAVDNRPGSPHRVETDLRFIDIRPFRRIYRYDESDMSGMPAGAGLVTLGEIIRRERFVLNRTLRAQKQFAAGGAFDFGLVDRLAATQAELAQAARRLAEFFDVREIDGADLMFQAEQSMLAAADSLSAGNFETASLQQRDALRFLVEARNTVEQFLLRNPQLAAQIAEADRRMSQKLRRNRGEPRRIAGELRQLAREEGEVSDGLGMLTANMKAADPGEVASGSQNETPTDGAGAADSDGAEQPSAEPEDAQQPAGGGGEPSASDEEGTADAMPTERETELTPQELEDRQSAIVRRATDIEAIVRNEPGLTDLARDRMQAALQSAQQARDELSRGETDEAAATAGETAEMFSELARQVEALMTGEAARRIAEARDLASELAERERRLQAGLSDEPNETGDGAGESTDADAMEEEPAVVAGREAERIARSGETLLDLLNSVTETDDPVAAETAGRLERTVRDERVDETVTDMRRLVQRIGGGDLKSAREEAGSIAGRLETVSRRLDQLYRSIVAPMIEELAQLEARAAKLREELDDVENRSAVAEWNREMQEFLDELLEVGGLPADELRQSLVSAEWVPGERGRLIPPETHRTGLENVIADLQARIQELLLADVLASDDGAVPPDYREFVERYYEVLSSSVRGAMAPVAE